MADEKYLTKEGLQHYTDKVKEKIKEIHAGKFIGNFATKALLDAYIGTMSEGDYAVVEKDETRENKTNRYRYEIPSGQTAPAWIYEYTIENNDCIKLLGNEPGSGQPYHFPFNINALVQDASQISTTFDTLTLDNNKTKTTYPIVIPKADVTNDKAGLYTKSLADEKLDKDTTSTDAQAAYIVKYEATGGLRTHTVMKIAAASTETGLAQMDVAKNYIDQTFVNNDKIEDSCASTDASRVLAAPQGKVLMEKIENISLLGRYLSLWNCTTGLPLDNPPGTLPYTYQSGDYYIIGTVGTGATLYRPSGSQYTGAASTAVESEQDILVNYAYRYDGTAWLLVKAEVKSTSFASLAGEPTDNIKLASALNSKLDTFGEITPGQPCRVPYFFEIIPDGNKVTVKDYTIQLNNTKTKEEFTLDVPLADIANDKAGLYNKKLADAKADTTALAAEITRATTAEQSNATAIANEVTRAQGVEAKKTDASTATANGTSQVSNVAGESGAVIYWLANDNQTKSALAVNDSDVGGPSAQIYAIDPSQTNVGSKLNVRKEGLYYLKNKATPATEDANDEIATVGTVNTAVAKKTDSTMAVTGGTSQVSNVAGEGGAAMIYTSSDNHIKSAVAINDNKTGGPAAQIYAYDPSATLPNGVKINVVRKGIYYLKSKATPATDDGYSALDEIARMDDMPQFFGEFDYYSTVPTGGSGTTLVGDTGEKKKGYYAVVKTDETENPVKKMRYAYDGAGWVKEYEIGSGSGTTDDCIKLLGNEATSGEPYHFTYYYSIQQEADKIQAKVNTITLDNNKTLKEYTLDVPSADTTNNKAGLYNATIHTGLTTSIGKRPVMSDHLVAPTGIEEKFGGQTSEWYITNINNHTTQITDITTDVSSLSTSLNNLTATVDGHTTSISTINQNIGSETTSGTMLYRIKELETTVATLNTALTALTTRVTNLETNDIKGV